MKKRVIILSALALTTILSVSAGNRLTENSLNMSSTKSQSGGNDVFKIHSFSIKTGLVFPQADYKENERVNMGASFEIGSLFYFTQVADEKIGIGLNVNWLQLQYMGHKQMEDVENYYGATANTSIGLGPLFSYNPSGLFVIDTYYKLNFCYNGSYENYNEDKFRGDVKNYNFGPGVRNSLGLNFRYTFLTVGIEYNFGKTKNKFYDDEKYYETESFQNNTFTTILGVTF